MIIWLMVIENKSKGKKKILQSCWIDLIRSARYFIWSLIPMMKMNKIVNLYIVKICDS